MTDFSTVQLLNHQRRKLQVYDAPPRYLFVELNAACNLRCGHCLYWQRAEKDRERWLPVELREAFIREFAAMGGQYLVSCGGEPLLVPGAWFEVARLARELGLRFLSVTNGTLFTHELVKRAIAEGPHEITISLDGLEETHDKARGVKGSFAAAFDTLDALAREKLYQQAETKLYAMTIVCERNYRELPRLAAHLKYVGVERLKLNFLQPTFGGNGADNFFASQVVKDVEALMQTIANVETVQGHTWSADWKRVVRLYHESIGASGSDGWKHQGTSEVICNSPERNIMLDRYGIARLCFSHRWPGTRLAREGDLEQFWHRRHSLAERMSTCTSLCGISHSVRRASATGDHHAIES